MSYQKLKCKVRDLCSDFAKLVIRVNNLENSQTTEVDNQVLNLSGNTLTLSGGLGPDTSVDLTQYLDDTDTDEQIITQFQIVGGNVVLSIENGNTVTIPLAAFQDGIGTDDQTISLSGNNLTIENGNTVDLSQYRDTFSVTKQNVGLNWVAARVNINGGFIGDQTGTVDATGATVTAGSGEDQGAGNRYTVTFPSFGSTDFAVSVLPIGLLTNAAPNGLAPHEISRTATSVTYGLNSGDDGQGLDETT